MSLHYYMATSLMDLKTNDTDNCIIDYNWSDDGIWNIMVTVIDDELDTDIIDVTATVLNRAQLLI